jgi:hypothetical protein
MFVMLMNAPCCFKKNPPWLKGLTNYFDDNQLCNANIVLRVD